MAIKGKAGSRGRRRSGGAPRPVPVEVTRPLLARRGFWVGALVIATAALSVGLGIAARESIASARASDLQRREAVVVRALSGEFETALADLQWVGEPDILGLPKAFRDVLDGATDAAGISTATAGAGQFLASLASARASLEAIDVPARVRDKGFGKLFVLRLIQARQRMLDGLELYRVAATITAQSAGLRGDAQLAAISSARDLATQAAAAVSDGYQNLVEAEVMAGTYAGPGQTTANLGG